MKKGSKNNKGLAWYLAIPQIATRFQSEHILSNKWMSGRRFRFISLWFEKKTFDEFLGIVTVKKYIEEERRESGVFEIET